MCLISMDNMTTSSLISATLRMAEIWRKNLPATLSMAECFAESAQEVVKAKKIKVVGATRARRYF